MAVLKALMAGPTTKRELERRTGRSETTIYNVVVGLRDDEGLLEAGGEPIGAEPGYARVLTL